MDLELEPLLDRPPEARWTEAEVRRSFGARAALLVLDVSALEADADAVGIVRALALAAAAHRAVAGPLIARGGRETVAGPDRRALVFDAPVQALLAALDAGRALAALGAAEAPDGRASRHAHRPAAGRIGLGFGDVLLIPGHDAFGPEAHRARALVGRVGRAGEVLVTAEFLRSVGALPAGVGAFRAPSDRETAAGFAFHVLADYRD